LRSKLVHTDDVEFIILKNKVSLGFAGDPAARFLSRLCGVYAIFEYSRIAALPQESGYGA
jgi:hypothetical protein